MIKVYMDVCCLNRPFNDHTQDRVRLESEAVLIVLTHIEQEEWLGVSSEAVEFEIDNDTNSDRRTEIQNLDNQSQKFVVIENDQEARALELQNYGFGAFDALHVACAEYAGADVLLTVDDRFLRIAKRLQNSLAVRIANPVVWLMEVLDND